MNIKVVFNKRLHKLQSGLKTLAEVRYAIKQLYKEKLGDQFDLLIQLDPITQEMALLDNENKFKQAINLYQDNNWPSLKILVTKDQQSQQQDLDLLNQSMIANKQKYIQKKNEEEELRQKLEEEKRRLEDQKKIEEKRLEEEKRREEELEKKRREEEFERMREEEERKKEEIEREKRRKEEQEQKQEEQKDQFKDIFELINNLVDQKVLEYQLE